jgi:hypothetical protein
MPAGLFAASLYALTVLLPASYQPPPSMTTVPPQATLYHVIYGVPGGDEIELLAVEVDKGRFQPEDVVNVTLYMRAASPIKRDYPLFVQLLGQEDLVVGNVTTHPGWGRLPTSLWKPGQIYSDQYRIPVWDNVSNRSPLMVQIFVGFADPSNRLPLPIRTAEGLTIDRAYVGELSVVANQPLDPSVFYLRSTDTDFSGQIRLIGYEYPPAAQVGGEHKIAVTILWEAVAQPSQDYTAFVHLVDEQGEQISGFDQPPAEGRFPTSLWQEGDRSLSRFLVDIPSNLSSGTYELWVGLYADAVGLERLPVTSTTHKIKDQRILLGTLSIQ